MLVTLRQKANTKCEGCLRKRNKNPPLLHLVVYICLQWVYHFPHALPMVTLQAEDIPKMWGQIQLLPRPRPLF